MSKFQELLGELDKETAAQNELAKSMPTADNTDANVQSASTDGATTADGVKSEGEEGEGKGDLTKSLPANPEDNVQVIEVDELIKSMTDLKTDLTARFDESEGLMAKALEGTLGLVKSQGEMLKTQGELIKSLKADVERLGNAGTGRKALVVAVERAQPGEHLTKSLPATDAPQPQQILAKCLEAQRAGKLTGGDVARAESALNHGLAVDPSILAQLS